MESKNIRRGDIYYVRGCNDTLGAEQKASSGRPAIIVSNNIGNEHSKIKQIVYYETSEEMDSYPCSDQ